MASTSFRVLVLACASLAAGCSERALLQDAEGRYRLVARLPNDRIDAELPRLLAAHDGGVVLFAQDRGAAAAALPHTERGAERPRVPVVAIDAPGASPLAEAPAVTRIVADHGATAAVDLALLTCHGIGVPPQLLLGASIAHPGAAERRLPSPGSLVLELLRREHAELLTDARAHDVVFRCGFVPLAGDGRHARAAAAAVTAAARYPQLVLERRDGDGTAARQAELGRELLETGCRALLVTADEPATLAPLAAACAERNAALLLVDATAPCEHATCSVGADPDSLGRAAGEVIRQLAPDGAAIVVVGAAPSADRQEAIERGLATALRLEPR